MTIQFTTLAARSILIWTGVLGGIFFISIAVWGIVDYHGRTDALLIGMASIFILMAVYMLIKGLRLKRLLVLSEDVFEIYLNEARYSYQYSDILSLDHDLVDVNFSVRLKDGFSFLINSDLRMEVETLPEEYREMYLKHGESQKYQSLRFLKEFFQHKTHLHIK